MAYVSIGERIAMLRRRRGMFQEAVAGRLGRSVQWLSNIERGVRSADRYSILTQIADVLRVSVTELTGDGATTSAEAVAEHEAAHQVVMALPESRMAQTSGSPATLDVGALRRGVQDTWALVHDTRYSQAAAIMRTLMEDCELAVRAGGEPWPLLAQLYQAVAAMMSKVGEADAAWVAADRSIFAALQARDVRLAAAGSFRLGHAFLNAGKPEQAWRAAEAAIVAVKPRDDSGDCDATMLWGALSLVRAVAAARLSQAGAAASAMSDAEQAGSGGADGLGVEELNELLKLWQPADAIVGP